MAFQVAHNIMKQLHGRGTGGGGNGAVGVMGLCCNWQGIVRLGVSVVLGIVSLPKRLTQCRNISEWRRCFILLVWLRRKGIIISVSLNGAMAVMSNQLKSRLESGVTTPRLHQVKTGQKRSQLTLL